MKISTKNIHIGVKEADPNFGSVVPPIYSTSTYVFPSAEEGALRFLGKSKGMIYSRFTNPTVLSLEKRIASLEEGEMAIAVSSGMAAISLTLLHFLNQGDSLITHKVLYGGTFEFLSKILPRFGIKVYFVDFNNISEIENFIDKTTKILYFESPTNPILEIIDIKAITNLAKKYNLLTVFDNTFAPPPIQFPLKMGVDIVIHSLTKYLSGHSDMIGGVIVGPKKLLRSIYFKSYIFFGPTLSPFSAYLALRGMTTLTVRLKKQSSSALKIARFLEKNLKIKKVYYPGLPSHPQYKLAIKQMNNDIGFGGVLSFELKGGYEEGKKLVNSVKLINLAVSLGAVESLIEHPASMTHSELTKKEREKAGINDSLIRISVGLEDVDDLIDDLNQALNKI